MKRSTRLAALAVGVGAIGLAGLIAVSPAVAGVGPGWGAGGGPGGPGGGPGAGPVATAPGGGQCVTDGQCVGGGLGGPGVGRGAGMRDGSCLSGLPSAPAGTLTETQQETLAEMAQEEKMSHDLYVAFADRYDAVVFGHIARAETQHLTAVRTLLDRYGLADPTADQAPGEFTDPRWQARYDELLARGQASEQAALGVGVTVEETDIADLRAAQEGLDAADVGQVYARLLAASQRHLAAFQAWAAR